MTRRKKGRKEHHSRGVGQRFWVQSPIFPCISQSSTREQMIPTSVPTYHLCICLSVNAFGVLANQSP